MQEISHDPLFIDADLNDPLHGYYFHTFNDEGKIDKQGYIVRTVSNLVLVTYFSWLDGHANRMQLVRLTEVAKWNIYIDREEMQLFWEMAHDLPHDKDDEKSVRGMW